MEYQFAYLVWCAVFAVCWVLLYYLRADARRDMVLFSLFAAPLGPLTQYLHLFDYWRPLTVTGTPLGPEDVLVAFFIGGITVGLYSFVKDQTHVRRERAGVLPLIVSAYVLGILLMYGGFFILGLSSIEVAVLTLGLFGFVPIVLKPWIGRAALLNGVVFAVFLFVFEVIYFSYYIGIVDAWWFGATWGRFVGVPYEEILWGFLWGVAGAAGSELVARIKFPR
jgi:hypothetical protein